MKNSDRNSLVMEIFKKKHEMFLGRFYEKLQLFTLPNTVLYPFLNSTINEIK